MRNKKESYKTCKTCKYFNKGFCDNIWIDDKDYVHNNSELAGINISISDDSGLDASLRVNENFGCILYDRKDNEKYLPNRIDKGKSFWNSYVTIIQNYLQKR